MTILLEQALAEVKKRPDSEQELILEELADGRRWDQAFARSSTQLAKLATKARADVGAGRVKKIGMDEL